MKRNEFQVTRNELLYLKAADYPSEDDWKLKLSTGRSAMTSFDFMKEEYTTLHKFRRKLLKRTCMQQAGSNLIKGNEARLAHKNQGGLLGRLDSLDCSNCLHRSQA